MVEVFPTWLKHGPVDKTTSYSKPVMDNIADKVVVICAEIWFCRQEKLDKQL